ncbi:MAG: hypothetical protein J6C37_00045, partial [Roseburia sp.]|nr:hypothetical protein [Roseburia sp.]
YQAVLRLWEFLKSYNEVGYSIEIVEQNPEINERFQEDIYRNIMFNYLILKGYLESERDRKIPFAAREKSREIKPKMIHRIIEELTEDYDLPDVEIRKVLIEELTKEQLMHEEAAERLRMVEEQEERRTEEEKLRRAEMRQEKERIRKEKEEEEQRRREELKLRSERDQRRSKIFQEEIQYFKSNLEDRVLSRREKEALWYREKEDFADAAQRMEDEELRQKAMEYLKAYAAELTYFAQNLDKRRKLRTQAEEEWRKQVEEREMLRRERLVKKTLE